MSATKKPEVTVETSPLAEMVPERENGRWMGGGTRTRRAPTLDEIDRPERDEEE